MMKYNKISVCIFSRNPQRDAFLKVIEGLKLQSLPAEKWNIRIIDNDSNESIERSYSGHFSFHPDVQFIVEKKRGLFFAQQCAVRSGDGDLIVILGDECVLRSDYLEKALIFMNSHPLTGYLAGNNVMRMSGMGKNLGKYFSAMLYPTSCSPEVFEQSVDVKKYTPATRGSGGAVITREIADSFTGNSFYIELIELLGRHGIDKLRGTDLDLPMISLSIGRKIVRSNELFFEDIENSHGENYRTYVKRIVEEGFFNELFKHRWGWTSDFLLSNIFYSSLNIYRAEKISSKVNFSIRLIGMLKFYYLAVKDREIASANRKIAAHFKKGRESQ